MPDYILNFGKYRGQDISMCPRSYLQWLQEQDWIEEELREQIELDLAQRDRSYDPF